VRNVLELGKLGAFGLRHIEVGASDPKGEINGHQWIVAGSEEVLLPIWQLGRNVSRIVEGVVCEDARRC